MFVLKLMIAKSNLAAASQAIRQQLLRLPWGPGIVPNRPLEPHSAPDYLNPKKS
jgi:hypothetical protein